MSHSGMIRWLPLAIVLATLATSAQAADGLGEGPMSISGSYVYLNTVVSPEDCFVECGRHWFCFQAISSTSDYDYVYYLWLRFPDGWQVHDATLYDVPYCVNGGTFAGFSWWAAAANEVRIQHVRYQAPTDTCTAYYCLQVTPTSLPPGETIAFVSWYWQSSAYGSPPFYPCSSDGYTPAGQPACDEALAPPANIVPCDSVFCDDFERGDTTAWSTTQPAP